MAHVQLQIWFQKFGLPKCTDEMGEPKNRLEILLRLQEVCIVGTQKPYPSDFSTICAVDGLVTCAAHSAMSVLWGFFHLAAFILLWDLP